MAERSDNRGVLHGKYELGRLLGHGTFAKVYLAKNLQNGKSVAMKVVRKERVIKVGMTEQVKREISVMKMLKHPNIIELHEVMASKTKIYFAMELIRGGELFAKITKGRMREDVARNYFQQLISAVDFCHSRGVYHRDLKPENLLLDEDENLKVSDFGLSAFSDHLRQDGLLHTTCGTPAYVAPEVICNKGYDGAKSDIWSCGVILFLLIAGYLPFQEDNIVALYKKIYRGDFKCPGWFSSESRRLVTMMLDPNPNSRISIAKIMDSPWFKTGSGRERNNKEAINVDSPDANADDESAKTLNAFHLISLSRGFDLSALFEGKKRDENGEMRFATAGSGGGVVARLEEVAAAGKFRIVKKRGGKSLRLLGEEKGRKGKVEIGAEIFGLTASLAVVEVKKLSGDTFEYEEFWRKEIRPALKDFFWNSSAKSSTS